MNLWTFAMMVHLIFISLLSEVIPGSAVFAALLWHQIFERFLANNSSNEAVFKHVQTPT